MNSQLGFLVAVGVLGLIRIGDFIIDSATRLPDEVTPLSKPIDGFPMSLNDWKGVIVEHDPEVDEAVGADSIVNRIYTHEDGTSVRLHFVVWSHSTGLPHDPHVCYAGAGYTVSNERMLLLGGPENATVLLMELERADNHLSVLYWYQMDQSIFYTYDGMRTYLWRLRGLPTRPPLVKVMLACQSKGTDTETRLKELAGAIYRWQND